jgi:hypothetical protein
MAGGKNAMHFLLLTALHIRDFAAALVGSARYLVIGHLVLAVVGIGCLMTLNRIPRVRVVHVRHFRSWERWGEGAADSIMVYFDCFV